MRADRKPSRGMRSRLHYLYYPTNMALSCLTSVQTTIRGVFNHRWLLSRGCLRPVWCNMSQTQSSPQEQRRTEEEYEGPEYIPRRKAKSPMSIVGYAWMIGLPAGIVGFLLTKRQVDKNRLKQRKVRQRMKQSNEGQLEGSRYYQKSEDVTVNATPQQ